MDVIKAYLTFSSKSGLMPVNVGAAIKSPSKAETISERILSEFEVQNMIRMEPKPRNRALLRILYDGALHVSELSNLRWSSVSQNGDRPKLSPEASKELMNMPRGEDGEYVFRSRQKTNAKGESKDAKLASTQVLNIMRAAAKRAGVHNAEKISPHWMRHSHATHVINRKAPLTLVRDTLGHSNISIANTYAHMNPDDSPSSYLPAF